VLKASRTSSPYQKTVTRRIGSLPGVVDPGGCDRRDRGGGVSAGVRAAGGLVVGESRLREGAFLVARGRLSQEDATGSKLFVDEIDNLYPGAWPSALVISIEESTDWSPASDTRAGY
jgi:hypothetical protein